MAATVTDGSESVRRKAAQLFGRASPDQADQASRQLEEACAELSVLTGGDLAEARAALAQLWASRLMRLLGNDPAAEADVRELVAMANASGGSVHAGRDLTASAPDGIAAGLMRAEAIAGPGGTAIGRIEYRRPEIASQPVSLPPRPRYLAGREDLLNELRARLIGGPGPRVVVLCGLGGIGKSSVAAEYAHRYLDEAGLAWFFSAEDPALLPAEFTRLARQLGVTDPLADAVASVHGALAAMPMPWILVFDNAVAGRAVRRFLPPAGNGQILITTQDRLFPAGEAVDVPVLAPATAAAFLTTRTGDPDIQAAAELADLLGGLPLALEQAAAYMTATFTSLADYLGLYRERRADLLARGEVAAHPLTVDTTFSVAFSRLERDAPAAAGLLRLMGFLAPEPIPLDLLLADHAVAHDLDPDVATRLAPLLGDKVARADAVAAIRRFSLISAAKGNTVLMHRLVQAVINDKLAADAAAAWLDAAVLLVSAAIPDGPDQPDLARLLPHIQAVAAAGSDSVKQLTSTQVSGARPFDLEITEAIETLLARHHDLLAGPDGRRALLREIVRIVVVRYMLITRESQVGIANRVLASAVLLMPAGPARVKTAVALQHHEHAFGRAIIRLSEKIMSQLGFRLREPTRTLQHMVTACQAVIHGMNRQRDVLTAAFDGATIQATAQPWPVGDPVLGADTDHQPVQWTLAAYACMAIVDAFIEPVPNFHSDDSAN